MKCIERIYYYGQFVTQFAVVSVTDFFSLVSEHHKSIKSVDETENSKQLINQCDRVFQTINLSMRLGFQINNLPVRLRVPNK